mgnify:CR=1 FL=1
MELDLWTQSLVTAMTALWTKVANFIPNLFGALVVLLLGFVVAKLVYQANAVSLGTVDHFAGHQQFKGTALAH